MTSRSGQSAPFVVKGERRNGTVTYLCPSPEWALRKLADFAQAGYAGISATGPDGRPIGEDALAGLVKDGRESASAAT